MERACNKDFYIIYSFDFRNIFFFEIIGNLSRDYRFSSVQSYRPSLDSLSRTFIDRNIEDI